MKSRSSGYSSDSEQQNIQQQDLSVLRIPIHIALNGFLEAKRAYENGTEEIKRLLSRECGIIYECNICRNMFRNLTHFISHKRVYCRNSFNNLCHNNSNPNRNGYIDHDMSTIIQAEENYVNHNGTKNITKNNNSNNNNSKDKDNLSINNNKLENSNKDLTSIVERLLKREQENRLLKLTDFYDQVNNKLQEDNNSRKNHILQLDKVPNSTAAVYQTVKQNENEHDTMKNEVNEVHQLLENNENVLGPDGKIITKTNDFDVATLSNISSLSTTTQSLSLNDNHNNNNNNNKNNTNINKNSGDNNNAVATTSGSSSCNSNKNNSQDLSCKICHKKFSTEKMLKLHIQAKHITTTYAYQCPSCLEAFLKPGSVIRHLSVVHRKSARRIRLMRDSIFKRRVRMSDLQTRGPSRELARLRFRMDDKDSKNTSSSSAINDSTGIGATTEREIRGGSQLRLNDNGEWTNVNSPSCPYCGKIFERKAVLTTHLTNCPIKIKLNSSSSINVPITRRSNDNHHHRNSTSSSSNNARLNSNNSVANINYNFDDEIFLKNTTKLTTDKKSSSFVVHSVLASIDLTNDDSRSSSATATTSAPITNAGTTSSKRKRKKTSKVLKEDCNDIIESEKLNEMFLKLDCSDSNISSSENSAINKNIGIGIGNNDTAKTVIGNNVDVIKKEDSVDECSLIKIIKTKENDIKDDKKKLPKDAIKIETEMSDTSQSIENNTNKVAIKRKLSAHDVKDEVEEDEMNENNKMSQLEKQLLGNSSITTPVKSQMKKSIDRRLQNLNKSTKSKTSTSKSQTNQKQQKNENEHSNKLKNYDESTEQEEQTKQQQNVSFICKICRKRFDAVSNVRRHISMFHYRSRKFGCKICREFKAFRKCDVINHLSLTHSLTVDKEITLGFVEVFCNKNKNDSIEDDIIVIENNLLGDNNSTSTSEAAATTEQIKKRPRRQKLQKSSTTKSSAAAVEIVEIKQQQQQEQQQLPAIKIKFTRSSSNHSVSSNDDLLSSSTNTTTSSTSRRPIRNRVKPVHKDFVYDLSHILKKDVLSEVAPVGKTQKRRNTLATNGDLNGDQDQQELNTSLPSNKVNGVAPLAPPPTPPLSSLSQKNQQQQKFDLQNKHIKGSAYKMAKIAVTTFRAAFSQLSTDNLSERASIPPLRILPHMLTKDVNVSSQQESQSVILDDMKYRRRSDDSSITTHSPSKRKRLDSSANKQKSQFSSIYEKQQQIDNGGKNHHIKNSEMIRQNYSTRKNDGKMMVKCPTEKEFQEYLVTNKLTEPVKKIPVNPFSDSKILGTSTTSTLSSSSSSSTPSTPTSKRITLMQRLTENKNKKLQQSLLRSVLEN